MPVKTITAEIDGKVRKITADIPDDARPEEIESAVRQHLASTPTPAAPKPPRADSLKGPEGVTVQDDPNMQKGFWESLKDSVLAPIHLAQGLWDGTIKAQDIPRGMLESVGNTLIKAGAGNLAGAAGDVAGQAVLAKGPGMALRGARAAVNTPGVVPTALGVGATVSGHPYVGVPLAASGIADLAEHLQKPAAAAPVAEPPAPTPVVAPRVSSHYASNAPIRPPLAEPNPPIPEQIQPGALSRSFDRPVRPPLAQRPASEAAAEPAAPRSEPVSIEPYQRLGPKTPPPEGVSPGVWAQLEGLANPAKEQILAKKYGRKFDLSGTPPLTDTINAEPVTKATIKPKVVSIAEQLRDSMAESGSLPAETPEGISGKAYEADARGTKAEVVAKALHENGISYSDASKLMEPSDWRKLFRDLGQNEPGASSGDPTATIHQTLIKLKKLYDAEKPAEAPKPKIRRRK